MTLLVCSTTSVLVFSTTSFSSVSCLRLRTCYLVVELRGNPHVEVHVQVVVVGDEGTGNGPPGDQVHHGGFNLEGGVAVL